MVLLQWVLLVLAVAGGAWWLLHAIAGLRLVRSVLDLAGLHPPDPPRWPRVSLIIPARDEAATLEAAMASRLREDYPDLEFILIDDRSTDGTGAIIDALAARDPRIRPLHIEHLPAGWLGKVWALHRGTQLATGEWLLFTDADVHQRPGTLRRLIAHALDRRLDHLPVLPAVHSRSFWLDVALAGFLRLFLVGVRAWRVRDPDSDAAVGIGAFNLVRRRALDKTPGFEWLRLEPGDDVALGLMLKRSGAAPELIGAADFVSVEWYSTLRQMFVGSERGGFTVLSRFSLARGMLTAAGMLALEWGPFLALLPAGWPLVQAIGLLGCGTAVGTSAGLSLWSRRPVLPALLVPVGSALLMAMIVRAAWLGWRRGGILWRGTLYRTGDLRAGARVRFP